MFGIVFFFKQKTAYEMRISDWSSDVCSSDLERRVNDQQTIVRREMREQRVLQHFGIGGRFDDPGSRHRAHAVAEFLQRRIDGGGGGGAFGIVEIATEIGRASCRERVGQYVYISVVAVSLKKKKQK